MISVQNLSKRYFIRHEQAPYIALRDRLAHPFQAFKSRAATKAEEFWALDDISFELERGEVLGIIGPNGSGKSTLLKVLSQITPPTKGKAVLHGRLASLLEVGTGFHPELTGRENIFLSGVILGMTKFEVRSRFDEIVAFAGIEKFLDTPIKYYSSGMAVRLGFAVAAHLKSDILIIDEVLAVGDAEFQKKCLAKIDDVAKNQGRTILFVSHDMGSIQNLCSRSIVLSGGRIRYQGDTNQAIIEYLNFNKQFFDTPLADRQDRRGSGVLKFTGFELLGLDVNQAINTNKPFTIRLAFKIDHNFTELRNVSFSVSINDQINGGHLLVFWTETSSNFTVTGSDMFIECQVDSCPLVGGQYFINVYCTINDVLSDYVINAAKIFVDDRSYFINGKRDHESHPKYVVNHHWLLK